MRRDKSTRTAQTTPVAIKASFPSQALIRNAAQRASRRPERPPKWHACLRCHYINLTQENGMKTIKYFESAKAYE